MTTNKYLQTVSRAPGEYMLRWVVDGTPGPLVGNEDFSSADWRLIDTLSALVAESYWSELEAPAQRWSFGWVWGPEHVAEAVARVIYAARPEYAEALRRSEEAQ